MVFKAVKQAIATIVTQTEICIVQKDANTKFIPKVNSKNTPNVKANKIHIKKTANNIVKNLSKNLGIFIFLYSIF